MRLKKFVAREGLVLLGVTATIFGFTLINALVESSISTTVDTFRRGKFDITTAKPVSAGSGHFVPDPQPDDSEKKVISTKELIAGPQFLLSKVIGIFIIIAWCFYPVYWLARFVLWALKTLKEPQ